MEIVLVNGSMRKVSRNQQLLEWISDNLLAEYQTSMSSVKDWNFPVYNEDLKPEIMPEIVKASASITRADALIWAVPEYNFSISAPTKNALDWLSQLKPFPVANKPTLLVSCSPGPMGGIRGLWHARIPFEGLGAYVYPHMFALPRSRAVFDNKEGIPLPLQNRLSNLVDDYLDWAQRINSTL